MQFFTLIYDILQEQASKGGPFSGALFWNAAIGKEELVYLLLSFLGEGV